MKLGPAALFTQMAVAVTAQLLLPTAAANSSGIVREELTRTALGGVALAVNVCADGSQIPVVMSAAVSVSGFLSWASIVFSWPASIALSTVVPSVRPIAP